MWTMVAPASMPLAAILSLKSETSAGGSGLAAQPRGFRLNIWKALQPILFAFSTELAMPPGMEPVLKKFALAEARRAEKFLTEDLKRQNDVQRQALFSKIFYDLFGLKIDATGDGRLFKVKVPDYLARSSRFHEQEWKMINRL